MGKENKDAMEAKLGCGCCVDDRNILQGRITELEETIKALRQQSEIDFRVKKELDEKLDKVTADYRALWVQHQNFKSVNDALLHKNNIMNNAKANLIKSNQGLQSKVAKQANEIKRLTEELSVAKSLLHKQKSDLVELYSVIAGKVAAVDELADKNKALRDALEQASKDAEDNFERGKVKGMEELWRSLQWAQDRLKCEDNLFPVYGYYGMAACVDNLTATAFLRKTLDWQEKEARDIKIGDEVVIISPLGSDDSDYGIVYNIIEQTNGSKSYHIIGSGNCMAFGDSAITDGSVRKTGKHYNHIPFDYIV